MEIALLRFRSTATNSIFLDSHCLFKQSAASVRVWVGFMEAVDLTGNQSNITIFLFTYLQ